MNQFKTFDSALAKIMRGVYPEIISAAEYHYSVQKILAARDEIVMSADKWAKIKPSYLTYQDWSTGTKKVPPYRAARRAVARAVQCESDIVRDKDGRESLRFYGFKPDVDTACALMRLMEMTAERYWEEESATQRHKNRTRQEQVMARSEFQRRWADELAEMLNQRSLTRELAKLQNPEGAAASAAKTARVLKGYKDLNAA